MSKIEKFTQLKSLLTGDAAFQVKDITLSDANYDIVWANLEERY